MNIVGSMVWIFVKLSLKLYFWHHTKLLVKRQWH